MHIYYMCKIFIWVLIKNQDELSLRLQASEQKAITIISLIAVTINKIASNTAKGSETTLKAVKTAELDPVKLMNLKKPLQKSIR